MLFLSIWQIRTTTVLLTRRASSTLTTLHWSPTPATSLHRKHLDSVCWLCISMVTDICGLLQRWSADNCARISGLFLQHKWRDVIPLCWYHAINDHRIDISWMTFQQLQFSAQMTTLQQNRRLKLRFLAALLSPVSVTKMWKMLGRNQLACQSQIGLKFYRWYLTMAVSACDDDMILSTKSNDTVYLAQKIAPKFVPYLRNRIKPLLLSNMNAVH